VTVKHRNICFISAPLFAIIAIILTYFLYSTFISHERIIQFARSDSGEYFATAIPQNSILVNCAKPGTINPPFVITENPEKRSDKMLALPAGKGTIGNLNTGKASYQFYVSNNGVYKCWARVRWDDGCSNSLIFKIGKYHEKMFGQDAVYNSWHWVPIENFKLTKGINTITLKEREDGIAVDQLLLSSDPVYQPRGKIVAGKELQGGCLFADNFNRSQGHGLRKWKVKSGAWKLLFSMDPNRIPLQYALQGKVGDDKKVALCKLSDISLRGAAYTFNLFPTMQGEYGVSIQSRGKELAVLIAFADNGNYLNIKGAGIKKTIFLGDKVRLMQWHKLNIERWDTVLKVKIDGRVIFSETSCSPSELGIFFFEVKSGIGVFDDFLVKEIIYLADKEIPWMTINKQSMWGWDSRGVLTGDKGGITTAKFNLKIKEILFDKEKGGAFFVNGVHITSESMGKKVLEHTFSGNLPDHLSLSMGDKNKVSFRHFSLRFTHYCPDLFSFGPYNFNNVEDISDYMDFTDEEFRKMNSPENKDKFKRKARRRPIIGRGEKSVWEVKRKGLWDIHDSVLRGKASKGYIKFWQEFNGDLTLRFKIKLKDNSSALKVALYSNAEKSLNMTIATTKYQENGKKSSGLFLLCPEAGKWFTVVIATSLNRINAKIGDKKTSFANLQRGDGGGIQFMVPAGVVELDDIAVSLLREKEGYNFYGFDRRESDWWREGKIWCDHSGLACVFASNWTSLIAPEGSGMLLHKRIVGDNFLLAFNVSEASEWFGWSKKHSHIHYPWDNITIRLSSKKGKAYELRINSENRTKTVLLRNGKAVVSINQDRKFPIRYTGGHAPYSPRRCRVVLRKTSDTIILYLNGRKIFTYTDPKPVKTSELRLGGFKTRINFSNIELFYKNKKQSTGRKLEQ